jgi:MoaA/NifB/PqqE/SkfB family radical SAM enzyme
MVTDFSVTTDRLSTRLPTPGGPWRLTLVTDPDDCNLACDMCECGRARQAPGSGQAPRRMAPSLAAALLAEARGGPLKELIPSTMGEPLLWGGIDLLLDACAAAEVELNLTTNGTWPGRGGMDWGLRLAPVASDVKVSWNGASAERAEAIMAGLDFAAAVEGLRAFGAARDEVAVRTGHRCRLSFQVTAQAGNVDELPALVTLAASLGVDRVKVNQLQPRAPGLVARALPSSQAGRDRWNRALPAMEVAVAQAAAAGRVVALQHGGPLAPLDAPSAPPGPCPFLGREAWVLQDGTFAPCPHPAAWRGELGHFGSVAAMPLQAIWEGEPLARLLVGYGDHPVCRTCPLRRPGGAA